VRCWSTPGSLVNRAGQVANEATVRNAERDVYLVRMHAFVELPRWLGMDIIDAVLLRAEEQLKDNIDGQTVSKLIELAEIKPVQLTGKHGRPAVDDFGNP